MPPVNDLKWARKEYIDKAPVWCSVDLRDGNQSLIVPMSLDEKLEFFKYLVQVGFKEIEVGFPAASETEYEFLRTLIEQDLVEETTLMLDSTRCLPKAGSTLSPKPLRRCAALKTRLYIYIIQLRWLSASRFFIWKSPALWKLPWRAPS